MEEAKIKVRYIKKRLNPASKEVYDKVQFADSPEEAERRRIEAEKKRAAEAARIAAERKAAEEKRKAEEAERIRKQQEADALKKKQEAEAAEKKRQEDLQKKQAEDKKRAEEEAKKKALEAQKQTPKPEEKKEEGGMKDEQMTTSYKPPVYKPDPNFKLAESAFNKFKVPDPDDFSAMLEADFKNSRLSAFFPTPEDMSKMKKFLLDNHYYARLVGVHRYYQSQSNFPQIGFNDAMNLFKATKVFDDDFNQSKLSIIVAEANATGATKGNADKDLDRFEFMELIIRSAVVKYKHSGKVQKHREAVYKFLEFDFLPFAKSSEEEYNQWRIEKIWTVAVNKVLNANSAGISKLFTQVGGQDGSCDLAEVQKMIRSAGLNQCSNREVIWCFSMSQMAVVDETKGGYTKMDKKEFNEFLVRISIKQQEGKKDPLDVMVSNTLKLLIK